MNWGAVLDGLPWASLVLLALWFLRDRRKDRAAAVVAEKTVDADVALKNMTAEDARIVLIAKAHETERAGWVRAIEDRDREIARKDADLHAERAGAAHAQTVISRLRAQVEDLQARLDAALAQLNSVRQQLNELADDPTHGGGTSPV